MVIKKDDLLIFLCIVREAVGGYIYRYVCMYVCMCVYV